MTDDELQAYIDAGCPDCGIPWKTFMGVYFCKVCGLAPPSAIRFQ